MWAAGGRFELGGTIGQPDVGVVMSSGRFTLVGGFWPGTSLTCAVFQRCYSGEKVPADPNCES